MQNQSVIELYKALQIVSKIYWLFQSDNYEVNYIDFDLLCSILGKTGNTYSYIGDGIKPKKDEIRKISLTSIPIKIILI
jgi:hypothetical protein